ncbi:MAG: fructose-1,6-bisphosphatase, partial [Bacteroidales bacterium]|nr:fructose-1,6-bisphosphatase [Bacteroidales bacterium]
MNNSLSSEEIKFLQQLSKQFPTVQAASTEIINLEAIKLLPKGTEHYITDIHGEFNTFNHILSNASGSLRRKMDDVFGDSISDAEKRQLATIIYYPSEKISLLASQGKIDDNWYAVILNRLVGVAREVSNKYTRSKVRK